MYQIETEQNHGSAPVGRSPYGGGGPPKAVEGAGFCTEPLSDSLQEPDLSKGLSDASAPSTASRSPSPVRFATGAEPKTPPLALDAFAQAWAQLGPPSMAQIKRQVAQAHDLTVADLESPSRTRQIAWARQEAMWLCRQARRADGRPRFSFQQIAQVFGDRDHSTVLFACRAHERRLAAAP